jgi:polar amino acid transport system substrate-binding protein
MSKTVKILLAALAAIAVIAICAIAIVLLINLIGGEPEPTATVPVPETAPPPVVDDSWEKIKSAGKIVVGTAADYPPFEYFAEESRIDGFDIALMDEIGRRLGVLVEYHNFAFDGLGPALQLKQIDIAIAAISVTPDREALVDFTNVYLVGADGVLADENANVDIGSVEDVSRLRVGVQRGSVYQDWLQSDWVDTGQMPADNLLAYEKAGDAVRDLQQGRLELVVLDLQPADLAVAAGGVKLVAQGLHQQRYALALPKGTHALKAEIDAKLTELYNEGYIAKLAQEYLDMSELLPTPTPGPTSTPGAPPSCVDGLAFVGHGEGGDGTLVMDPGEPFTKVWKVLNSGTCTWDASYRLVYVHGNNAAARMGGQPTSLSGQVAPGQTSDVGVGLVAPVKPGTYQAYWQMENGSGQAFGERLPVTVRVPAAATATPAPTQTPAPGIIFTVDRDQVKAGECVTFYWKVENVKEVYFFTEGQRWQDNGVAGEGRQEECPPHTTTYYLRVVLLDNSVETRQITVYVEQVADAPYIARFTVDPPGQITLGQCVTLRWAVEGEVDNVSITMDGIVAWDPAPTKGNMQDCPDTTGKAAYGIEARGPGGTSRQTEYVNVVGAATATPVPTAAPEAPVIQAFSVSPSQVETGECVGVSWSVGGGTSYSRISRNGQVIIDDAGYAGQQMDCLDEAGGYTYRLEAYNPVGDSDSREQAVTVSDTGPDNPLAGMQGQATAINGEPVPAGTTLTAAFGQDGSLNGSAGCNSYSAGYLVDGSQLSIGPASATGMLCAEPVGIMEQESAFLAALESAGSYSIEGGELYLLDGSGRAVIEFIARQPR